jgi:hypothetical protein
MKLQKGALSLVEIAIGAAVVATISTAIVMSYDSSDSKAETMLATQREIASGLLRMKQDFSCYPLKLSGLVKREDAEQNACGGVNDLSNWKGPYVSASLNVTPAGEVKLRNISAEAVLTLVRVGNAWTLKTQGVQNEIIQKALVACPESTACLKMVDVSNERGGQIMEPTQFGLVFDGLLPPGANTAPLAVFNQTAVASIDPSGSFGAVGAIAGSTTYSSSGVAATTVGTMMVGSAPTTSSVVTPTGPTITPAVVYTPGAPGYTVPVLPPPAPLPIPPGPPVPVMVNLYLCLDDGALVGFYENAACTGAPYTIIGTAGATVNLWDVNTRFMLGGTGREVVLCGSGLQGDNFSVTATCPSDGGRGMSSRDAEVNTVTRTIFFRGGGGGG